MIKDIDTRLIPLLKKLAEIELIKQGHKLTGKLYQSAEIKQKTEEAGALIEAYYEDYAGAVNNGVAASRIPYSGISGRGGKSKYIEALVLYAQKRGMTNPKSAAFAIAAKHKKEGMCTNASKRFSKNGKRTGAFDDVLENTKITDMIDSRMGEAAETTIYNVLKNNEKL